MNEERETPASTYVDAIRMTVTPYGANLTFGLMPAHPPEDEEAVVVAEPQTLLRMSLEHAKVLAMMLRKNLLAYEKNAGIEIGLPADLYEHLGLTEELASWGDGGAS